jgi:protein transport protein SEC20
LTLYRYQTAFRRAQLSARRNLEAAQRAERELLLQSYLEPRSSNASPLPGQRRQPQKITSLSKEEKEVNASSDVTLALRRTHDMMASELSRSHFAHDTLKESTAALAQLSETYSTLDTMLARSKNLLGTLLTSQKSDTWYLETAFYILLSTIAWLVFRRLIYGPTWLLLWLPLKLLKLSYTLLIGIFTATGLIGGSNVSVRTSSMAARETVVNDSAMRGAAQATMSGVGAPSVNVGGGGGGGTSQGSASEGSGESVSEQVGRIIDESREEQAVPGEDATEEEQAQDQLNPKKRMWEDKEEAKEAQRKKDEL